MELDGHELAERCAVEVLPGGVPAQHHFMVDRLEDKVRVGATMQDSSSPAVGRLVQSI